MFRVLWISAMAGLLARLVAAQDTVQQSFPLPPFAMRLVVKDRDMEELGNFQDQLELVMTYHLAGHIRDNLSPGIPGITNLLTRENFDSVGIKSGMRKVFLGVTREGAIPKSEIQTGIVADAIFTFPKDDPDIPPSNATFVQDMLAPLVLAAITGEGYSQLEAIFMSDSILSIVTEMQISQEDTVLSQSSLEAPQTQQDGSGKNKGLKIAASVIFVAMFLMLVGICMILHVHRRQHSGGKKRRNKNRSKADDGKADDSDAPTLETPESAEDTDNWLDEWTKSITSIPVRNVLKVNKPRPVPRPATRQSRKIWLGCIAEEDDVIESDTQRGDAIIEEEGEEDEENVEPRSPSGRNELKQFDDVDASDLGSPSGRNELKQFDDVDLSAPADYEHQTKASMIYL